MSTVRVNEAGCGEEIFIDVSPTALNLGVKRCNERRAVARGTTVEDSDDLERHTTTERYS